MNVKHNSAQGLLDSSLAHHLRLALPSEKYALLLAGDPSRNADGSDQKATPEDPSFLALRAAFYNLLTGYVGLLEGQEHGGWTFDEETTVRTAVDALLRAA